MPTVQQLDRWLHKSNGRRSLPTTTSLLSSLQCFNFQSTHHVAAVQLHRFPNSICIHVQQKFLLLTEIRPKVHIYLHSYSVIFCFVPHNMPFNPYNDEHLCSIEKENELPAHSIITASWCNHPDKRWPNQTSTTLKVACNNLDTAKWLLTGCISIKDHLVNVCKDIWIPIRWVKCQGYSHVQDTWIGVKKCVNCVGEFHSSVSCNSVLSCKAGSNHSRTSPSCPSFMTKCDIMDNCFHNAVMILTLRFSFTYRKTY